MGVKSGPRIVRNGLVMIVDAANISSYSGSGNTWYDLSGNQNHASMTTYGNSLPIYQNNGFYFRGLYVNNYWMNTEVQNRSVINAITDRYKIMSKFYVLKTK